MSNPTMAPVSPLTYLKKELDFEAKEYMNLSKEDKETLKQWAIEEMKKQEIPIKE